MDASLPGLAKETLCKKSGPVPALKSSYTTVMLPFSAVRRLHCDAALRGAHLSEYLAWMALVLMARCTSGARGSAAPFPALEHLIFHAWCEQRLRLFVRLRASGVRVGRGWSEYS